MNEGGSGRADPTLRHERVHRPDDGAPAVLLVHGQLDAGGLGALDDLDGLGEVVREGLLAQQMFAGVSEDLNEFELAPGRDGDVGDLHRGVAGDLVQRAEHPLDTPPLGRGSCRRGIDVVAADNVQPVRRVDREVPVVDDPAAAHDGDAVIVVIGEP